MWNWLTSLLTGPVIGAAIDAYKAKLAAGNDRDRMAADLAAKELDLEARERAIEARLLVAEQGHWMTRAVRPLWAAPFVIYTWKLVVFDKVLGVWTHGRTDPLTGGMETLIVTVAAAYFGGRTIEKVASIFGKK